MAVLLAEELLLAVYPPDGTASGRATELGCGLGGALLVDLVPGGHAKVVNDRLQPPTRPDHPLLRNADDQVADERSKPQAWVTRFAEGTRRRLPTDPVPAGVREHEPYRRSGLCTREDPRGGQWAADAVRRTIDAGHAATVAASTVATSGGSR